MRICSIFVNIVNFVFFGQSNLVGRQLLQQNQPNTKGKRKEQFNTSQYSSGIMTYHGLCSGLQLSDFVSANCGFSALHWTDGFRVKLRTSDYFFVVRNCKTLLSLLDKKELILWYNHRFSGLQIIADNGMPKYMLPNIRYSGHAFRRAIAMSYLLVHEFVYHWW